VGRQAASSHRSELIFLGKMKDCAPEVRARVSFGILLTTQP
jgi:hypothetical protein